MFRYTCRVHSLLVFYHSPLFVNTIVRQELERCNDKWLAEVQGEFRHGCLSDENFAFLHGMGTTVLGSWVGGKAACGRRECQQLARAVVGANRGNAPKRQRSEKEGEQESRILREECGVCRAERASKARVASDASDPRFKDTKFVDSPAIFPNNDIKYATTKLRAQLFASHHQRAITFAVAKDTPSLEALREKPGIAAERLKWLQRHDRERGDLYGMLPLVVGMPVSVTGHIDRNFAKQLLRGKVGYVHS